jgi:chloramphenicol 3-O-phosphotransferase
VSVSPASQTAATGGRPVINLLVNSGSQVVASYGITITYPSNLLSVVAADVVAGAQGYVSAVNANTAGSIVTSGFDTAGKGPGTALDLLKITFTANAAGTANIGITVQTLTDAAYNNIGTPSGQGGTITISGGGATPARTATVVARTATRTATTAVATPTRTVTAAPTITQAPSTAGKVSIVPASQTAARGSTVNTQVTVNTGSQLLAAYGITIAYPSNLLSITAANVTAGSQGYVSATNANTAGSLVISGFDTAGKGPSTALALLNIAWTAGSSTGTATLTLTVQTLTNETYANVGTPSGSTAQITLN